MPGSDWPLSVPSGGLGLVRRMGCGQLCSDGLPGGMAVARLARGRAGARWGVCLCANCSGSERGSGDPGGADLRFELFEPVVLRVWDAQRVGEVPDPRGPDP